MVVPSLQCRRRCRRAPAFSFDLLRPSHRLVARPAFEFVALLIERCYLIVAVWFRERETGHEEGEDGGGQCHQVGGPLALPL